MDIRAAKLLLALAPGVGPIKFKEILHADPDCTWQNQSRLINQLPIHESAKIFLKTPESDRIKKILDWAEVPGQELLCLDDQNYPELLMQIHDPPPFLYVQGQRDNLQEPQLSIVGCRNMTPYGQTLALRFAKELAALGLTITSGLALGVDGMAHQGALQAQGKTIAVLGTGLNMIYPQVHHALAQDILARGGTLVSEFPPDVGIKREHFPQRNRIISGLSLGILVIEATKKSGSLITAKYALEQNRPVFAVPGSVNSSQSQGCHELLRTGAILVERAQDILQELYQPLTQWLARAKVDKDNKKTTAVNKNTLDLLNDLSFNTPTSLNS
jgi:DNA processing protein